MCHSYVDKGRAYYVHTGRYNEILKPIIMDNPKKKKQDRKLVATEQPWEVSTIQKKWKVTKKQLKEIVAKVGDSRKAVEAFLEEHDYPRKEAKDQKFKNGAPFGKDTR